MSPRADFDIITNKHGTLIGGLNYNLVIPFQEKQLIKVDLKKKNFAGPFVNVSQEIFLFLFRYFFFTLYPNVPNSSPVFK